MPLSNTLPWILKSVLETSWCATVSRKRLESIWAHNTLYTRLCVVTARTPISLAPAAAVLCRRLRKIPWSREAKRSVACRCGRPHARRDRRVVRRCALGSTAAPSGILHFCLRPSPTTSARPAPLCAPCVWMRAELTLMDRLTKHLASSEKSPDGVHERNWHPGRARSPPSTPTGPPLYPRRSNMCARARPPRVKPRHGAGAAGARVTRGARGRLGGAPIIFHAAVSNGKGAVVRRARAPLSRLPGAPGARGPRTGWARRLRALEECARRRPGRARRLAPGRFSPKGKWPVEERPRAAATRLRAPRARDESAMWAWSTRAQGARRWSSSGARAAAPGGFSVDVATGHGGSASKKEERRPAATASARSVRGARAAAARVRAARPTRVGEGWVAPLAPGCRRGYETLGSRGWEQIERAGRCSRRACRLTMISGRSRAARASPWSRSFKRAAADHKCTRHRLCRRSRRPRAAAEPARRAPPPLVRWERRPRRPECASCHPSVTLLEAPLPMRRGATEKCRGSDKFCQLLPLN